jgi:hypothetical protein
LLTTALVSITSLAAIGPAQAQASKPAATQANKPAAKPAPKPAAAPAAKPSQTTTCLCDDKPKARPASVRKTRRVARSEVRGGYYDYGSAGAYRGEWHGQWQVAPNMGPAAYGPPRGGCCQPAPVAYGPPASGCCQPGPAAYGPQPGAYYGQGAQYAEGYDEMAGLQIDPGGWSGGVGGGDPDAGGGGGGYGQVHFGLGGNQENGPTYNSYNQSFQYNPSQAGPFRPRLMGGFAPPAK